MNSRKADVVICGAGMAGVSAAYHLAVKKGVRNVVLVDERDPLTLTSDKGTEAYRNWRPGPDDTMVRFMNRSIDLLEELARETGNAFELNQRGYLFVGGTWVIGALSGYGIMASQAAGELLAGHVTGETLPDLAPAFLLERYENPAYQKAIAVLDGSAGQL